jgi:hypothetical protein
LVLEGMFGAPWINELKNIGQDFLSDRDHREFVIDLRSVPALSADGEDALPILIDNGARFHVSGIFMRQAVRHPCRRSRLTQVTSESKNALSPPKQGETRARGNK